MRKVACWGVVLISVALIMATGWIGAEKAPREPKTVNVGNFPATQNVAGTVDVGNLPFDGAGNLRVSNSQASLPLFSFVKLPGPIIVPTEGRLFATDEPIDVAGWNKVHVLTRASSTVFGRDSGVSLQFGGDDAFVSGIGTTIGGSDFGDIVSLVSAEVVGPEMRLDLFTNDERSFEIWLYLSR